MAVPRGTSPRWARGRDIAIAPISIWVSMIWIMIDMHTTILASAKLEKKQYGHGGYDKLRYLSSDGGSDDYYIVAAR